MNAFFERPVLAEVKQFTAWNEPNNKTQPTWNSPRLAGQYWRVLDNLCVRKAKENRECNVAAGEFLDKSMGNAMESEYFWKYVNGTGRPTTLNRWAWHAYQDGVASQEPGLKHFPSGRWGRLKHFREAIDKVMHNSKCVKCRTPNIWLTEQGVVYFKENKRMSVPLTKPKKPGETVVPTFIFGHPALAEGIMNAYVKGKHEITLQPQVARFFYYQILGEPAQWDSGLLEAVKLPARVEPLRKAETPREIYRLYREKTLHGK